MKLFRQILKYILTLISRYPGLMSGTWECKRCNKTKEK